MTLMALAGPSGILGQSEGRQVERRPAFAVLDRLRGPARVPDVEVSEATRVAALGLVRDEGRELLLSNLTGEPVDVEITGWQASSSCAILEAETCAALGADADVWSAGRRSSAGSRVKLGAYGVVSLV